MAALQRLSKRVDARAVKAGEVMKATVMTWPRFLEMALDAETVVAEFGKVVESIPEDARTPALLTAYVSVAFL